MLKTCCLSGPNAKKKSPIVPFNSLFRLQSSSFSFFFFFHRNRPTKDLARSVDASGISTKPQQSSIWDAKPFIHLFFPLVRFFRVFIFRIYSLFMSLNGRRSKKLNTLNKKYVVLRNPDGTESTFLVFSRRIEVLVVNNENDIRNDFSIIFVPFVCDPTKPRILTTIYSYYLCGDCS